LFVGEFGDEVAGGTAREYDQSFRALAWQRRSRGLQPDTPVRTVESVSTTGASANWQNCQSVQKLSEPWGIVRVTGFW